MDLGWFACPSCGRDLVEGDGELRCSSGHRFEVGRRGYAALVVGRSSLVRSDPASVLDAVDAQWSSAGDEVVAAVDAMVPSAPALRVVDCGGDLGHLVSGLRERHSGVDAVFVSSSPSAIVRAVGRSGAAGVLMDPARPWPVRDGAADVVLCGFGEWRPAEFHRVLRGGGVAIVAVPQERAREVDDDLYPWFEHDQTRVGARPGGVPSAVIRFRRRRRALSW